MPKFPYVADRNAPYDDFIVVVQRKLNCLKSRSRIADWPYLKDDGYYGKQTEKAVRCFKIWKMNVANGVFDSKTNDELEMALRVFPSIIAKNSISRESSTPKKEDPKIIQIADAIMSFIENLDNIVKEEIEYAKSLGRFDAKIVGQRFTYHISSLDPKIKRLKKLFNANFESKKRLSTLDTDSVSRYRRNESFTQRKARIDVQKSISREQGILRYTSKSANSLTDDFVNGLKKWNLLDKIVDKVKQLRIPDKLNMERLKKLNVKPGGVFLLWNLKDIIYDLCQYDEWGEEAWKQDFLDDCYKFLDGLIIGFASTIIAQLIVAAVALAAGVTISGGWIVAIVALLAVIIAFLIGKFIEKYGESDSITKYLIEDVPLKLINFCYDN